MTRTDDFDRANGALGANWSDVFDSSHQIVISSNTVFGEGATSLNGAYWSADSWTGDHESQAVSDNGASFSSVGVRLATTGGGQGYVYFSHGSIQKIVGGANSQISAGSAFVGDDIAKIRIIGDDLEWFINGVSQGTFSDASIGSGGAPGIVIYDSVANLDDWAGTDFAVGGGSAIPVIMQAYKRRRGA